MERLRQRLAMLCAEKGTIAKVRPITFERWRFQAKWEEDSAAQSGKKAAASHPVLPREAPQAAAELSRELSRQGLNATASAEVAKALSDESKAAADRLLKFSHQAASGQKLEYEKLQTRFHAYSVDLRCGKVFLKISREAYGKLALLFRRHGPAAELPPTPVIDASAGGGDDEAAEIAAAVAETSSDVQAKSPSTREALHLRMFALLLRYKSLRGHGFQAAIGKPVWQLLRTRLGVACECFASPLNASLPAFASAFVDVDGHFGSRGSFFKLAPLSGSYAANPPFVHAIMDAAAEKMGALLEAAAASGEHALSFVVFLPGWEEGAAFAALSASRFLRAKVLVAAADHGFCDGASHQRQDPYRHSPYDTCVFVLQTDKASRRWPIGQAPDSFERELRAAMAECVPSEAAVGRQLQKTPAALGAKDAVTKPKPTHEAPKRDPRDVRAERRKRERAQGIVRDSAAPAPKKRAPTTNDDDDEGGGAAERVERAAKEPKRGAVKKQGRSAGRKATK